VQSRSWAINTIRPNLDAVVSLRTVKVLALNSVGPNLNAVVGFLRCFWCTEKIYIEVNFRLVK
jgi:hypothetical protein